MRGKRVPILRRMGTDIHALLEWDAKGDGMPFEEEHWTYSLAYGEMLLSRDYVAFAAMCGVRASEGCLTPLFAPRGLPSNPGEAVIFRYYRIVEDNFNWTESVLPMLPAVSKETARTWVKQGLAHYGPGMTQWERGNGRRLKEVERRRVSNPDWHDASWLRPSEFRAAFAHFDYDLAHLAFDWQIMLHTMNEVERLLGSERVRFVFWFDS